MVAWEPTVPGTANSTEGMVSVVTGTEDRATSMAMAAVGSMSKVNGSSRARPTTPPSPGMAPSAIPTTTPNIMNRNRSTLNSAVRPSAIASNTFRSWFLVTVDFECAIGRNRPIPPKKKPTSAEVLNG